MNDLHDLFTRQIGKIGCVAVRDLVAELSRLRIHWIFEVCPLALFVYKKTSQYRYDSFSADFGSFDVFYTEKIQNIEFEYGEFEAENVSPFRIDWIKKTVNDANKRSRKSDKRLKNIIDLICILSANNIDNDILGIEQYKLKTIGDIVRLIAKFNDDFELLVNDNLSLFHIMQHPAIPIVRAKPDCGAAGYSDGTIRRYEFEPKFFKINT